MEKDNSFIQDEEEPKKMEDFAMQGDYPNNMEDISKYKSGPFPGDDDFDENNAPLHFVVNEWAQGTSIHGVPFVTDAIQWKLWKRLVWFVLVLVSSGFFLWQFESLLSQYLSYEVITDTESINPPSSEFPEITICNLMSFSQSRKEAANVSYLPRNEEELMAISFPLEGFILNTWFNGKELNVTQVWKPVLVNVFGLCWKFQTEERVTRPGYYGGLRVWMDLQQDDFDRELAEYAGVAVSSLQKGELLTTQVPIYGVKPGIESMVGLRKTQYIREKTLPWARCHSEVPEYSQPLCREECLAAHFRTECGCRRYMDRTHESLEYCHTEAHEKCTADAFANEPAIIEKCDCQLPPCSQTLYEGQSIEVNRARVWLDQFDYAAYNVTPQYLLENFVSVTINYQKLQYDLLTESKGMTFAQLLGAIGGSMGFFLGISMISIFELLGDLTMMRLIPRWFGYRHLYGVGARKQD